MNVEYKNINSNISEYIEEIRFFRLTLRDEKISLWVLIAGATFHEISDDYLRFMAFFLGLYFYYRMHKLGNSDFLNTKKNYKSIPKIEKIINKKINNLIDPIHRENLKKRMVKINKIHSRIFVRDKKSCFGLKKIPYIHILTYCFYMFSFMGSFGLL